MNLIRLILVPVIALITACGFAQETIHQFIPTDNCVRCHEVPGARDAAAGITERVRMSEWKIWKEQDKHASAYDVLSEPRSQRIGQLLGKDVLAKDTGCIHCHTSNAIDELWSPACFRDGKNFASPEGVSCQSCHGPAEHWEAPHYAPEWRNKSLDEKRALGFNIMENPRARAEMCTSCHVGNAELRRMITHEMYAAGHPMLSGFEMESFADKMPRHWRYSHEKPGGRPFSFERTRAVFVGSVAAMTTAVQLAAVSRETWPELARLECYSCHHELRTPSWRQEDHREQFGRPHLELGCLPLVRVASSVANAAGAEEFETLIELTRQPFADDMFGDPAKIAELRTAIESWSSRVESQWEVMPLDEAKVRQILAALLNVAAEETHDYDTARQLTGAIYVVAEELSRSGAQVRGLSKLLTKLKALEDDERGFALVSTTDKRVEDKFHLQLANRARFKPQVYNRLLETLREGMKDSTAYQR